MDPNTQQPLQPITPQSIQQPSQLQQNISNKSQLPKILLMVLWALVVLGLIGGAYYLGTQKNTTIISNEKVKTLVNPTKEVHTTPINSVFPTTIITSQPISSGQVYSSAVNNYSFQYPLDWQAVIISSSNQDVVVVPNSLAPALKADIQKGEDGVCHPYYPIEITDVTNQSQTDRFANTNYQVVTQSPISISGINAKEYSVNMNFKPCDFDTGKSQSIIVSHNGKIFSIDLNPSDVTAYKQVFDQLVSSFKFTN